MRALILALALGLAGCASTPDELTASYASPVKYRHYACADIGLERSALQRRMQALEAAINKNVSDDQANMTIGLLLFWPSLFFIEGDDSVEAQEYRALKGDYEALAQASADKGCPDVQVVMQ